MNFFSLFLAIEIDSLENRQAEPNRKTETLPIVTDRKN